MTTQITPRPRGRFRAVDGLYVIFAAALGGAAYVGGLWLAVRLVVMAVLLLAVCSQSRPRPTRWD